MFTLSITPPDAERGVFIVYGRTTPKCPYCDNALQLLSENGRTVNYRSTSDDAHFEFLVGNGFKTVPQIWHGTRYVGGFDDLKQYLAGAYE